MDTELGELLELWKNSPGDEAVAVALMAAVQEEQKKGNDVLLKVSPLAISAGIRPSHVRQFGEILSNGSLQFRLRSSELVKASNKTPIEFTVSSSRGFLGFGNLALGQIAFFEPHEVLSMESQAVPKAEASGI